MTQEKEGKGKLLLHVREVSKGAEKIQTEMLTTPVECTHKGAVHRCHAKGKGLILPSHIKGYVEKGDVCKGIPILGVRVERIAIF